MFRAFLAARVNVKNKDKPMLFAPDPFFSFALFSALALLGSIGGLILSGAEVLVRHDDVKRRPGQKRNNFQNL